MVSKTVAKEQMIRAAGLSRRKLVSKPLAYFVQSIVSRMKAPPEGMPPRRKESPKETAKIQRISTNGMLKLE